MRLAAPEASVNVPSQTGREWTETVVDIAAYQQACFAHPAPPSRFRFRRLGGVSIALADLAAASAFYTAVLGPRAEVEGDAHGWRIGDAWLTLLADAQAGSGESVVGFSIALDSPAEAERLQRAFAAAGATTTTPQDTLMYEPVRRCPVVDPFGTHILLIAANAESRAE
jgi:hypothetical protein